MPRRKPQDPFSHIKAVQDKQNTSIFNPPSTSSREIYDGPNTGPQDPWQTTPGSETGGYGGSGWGGGMDTDPGQYGWADPDDDVSEEECFNVLGQVVSCDSGSCSFGPCGDGDGTCGMGLEMVDGECVPIDSDDCVPQYNELGQCIACCG